MRPTDAWAKVTGTPQVVSRIPVPNGERGCPACGSLDIDMMTVEVENSYLTTGNGIATYGKCAKAGCKWQSEMVVRAV